MPRTKVVIDTDAGIDDAIAIFMVLEAHKRGELEVLAITTVKGNTQVDNVNVNVQRILHTAGLMEIPLYSGASTPLIKSRQPVERDLHGSDGFGDASLPPMVPQPVPIQDQQAAWALINLAKKYPDEIVLATLGPLTNVALAIKLDPSFTSNFLSIYVMGGNTKDSTAEFNFCSDPEAAYVVLEETLIPIHLIPWQACRYAVSIPYSVRDELRLLKNKNADLLNKIEGNLSRRRGFETWVSCDPVAMAWVIDDIKHGKLKMSQSPQKVASDEMSTEESLVTTTESCFASVQLQGDATRGLLLIDYGHERQRTPNLIIMTRVNSLRHERYLRMAFGGQF